MDHKIERLLVNEFKTLCIDYRKDYRIVPNKYDKLADVLITQVDIVCKKHRDPNLIHLITGCFLIATIDILKQGNPSRFLDMCNILSKTWQIDDKLIKSNYQAEITVFINFLKKNKSSSFFSTPTQYDSEDLANKYHKLQTIAESAENDEEQRQRFKRITIEEEEFLQTLCNTTFQSPRG